MLRLKWLVNISHYLPQCTLSHGYVSEIAVFCMLPASSKCCQKAHLHMKKKCLQLIFFFHCPLTIYISIFYFMPLEITQNINKKLERLSRKLGRIKYMWDTFAWTDGLVHGDIDGSWCKAVVWGFRSSPQSFPTDCRNILLIFATCLNRLRQMVLKTTSWVFWRFSQG